MAIIDKEFGEVKIRRSRLSRKIKLTVDIDGVLSASIPYFSPDFAVKRLISQNRPQIRKMLAERSAKNFYRNGDTIGKSHSLIFRKVNSLTSENQVKIKIESNQIIVFGEDFESPLVQAEIRKTVSKILRKQAKAYLPRRVNFLAEKHGFTFEKLRFSHTKTRWGSCSSRGTISLNIALMKLPFELIDYVIIHELCHTRQMNHSPKFWAEVEKYCPNYRDYVRRIKNFSPEI